MCRWHMYSRWWHSLKILLTKDCNLSLTSHNGFDAYVHAHVCVWYTREKNKEKKRSEWKTDAHITWLHKLECKAMYKDISMTRNKPFCWKWGEEKTFLSFLYMKLSFPPTEATTCSFREACLASTPNYWSESLYRYPTPSSLYFFFLFLFCETAGIHAYVHVIIHPYICINRCVCARVHTYSHICIYM